MVLYGQFQNLDGVIYRVEINTHENDGGQFDVMMGETPAIIASSSSKLLDPIKSRSLTLEIYATEWYKDLYEPAARKTSVKLYEYDENAANGEGEILFRGWMTPCRYDQSFTPVDTIQLEGIDGISSAKDFKWQNNNRYNSFFEILIGILKDSGYQGTLYVPESYESINNQYFSGNVLDALFASSANFLDDNEERTPWTEYEVVEEMMKFLGWSLCPYGDDVWCVDYRYENAGTATYHKYDIQTGTSQGTYSSNASPTPISLDDMAAGESNLSIDDIYNRIEVSDNIYKIDEISPDIFDDSLHISVTDEAEIGLDQSKWSKIRRKRFLFWTWDSKNEKDYLEGTDYQTFCRIKEGTGWKHHFYRMSDLNHEIDNEDGKNYYDAATHNMSAQQPYNWNGQDDKPKVNDKINAHGCLLQHYAYVDESHPNNVPSSIDWTNILTFFILGPTSQTPELRYLNDLIEKPVLEYTIDEEVQWKPSTGKSWIYVKGSLFYQNGTEYKDGKKTQKLSIVNTEAGWYCTAPVDKSLTNLPSDMNYGGIDCTRTESDLNYGRGFELWKMSLQIGDKWWNGRSWTTTQSTFYISFNNNPDNENDEYLPAFQWMDIVSNTTFKDKVGEDCYAIPIDSEIANDPSFGSLKLTIYTPRILPDELFNGYARWLGTLPSYFGLLAPVVFCKDFEVGYIYTDSTTWWNNHSDSNNTDKVYIGYIDDDYVQDFDELSLKLNTTIPDKPISRSFVCTSNGYLNTMKHKVADEEKEQEYNIVDMYLDHHSDRRVIYDRSMHGLFEPNSKFSKLSQFDGNLMIDNYSYDVRNDNNDIKFIEF